MIATPANYGPNKLLFDTSYVEQVIGLVLDCNPNAAKIVKLTVPVSYTKVNYIPTVNAASAQNDRIASRKQLTANASSIAAE